MEPLGIYEKLFSHYGTQGWWPTTPEGKKKPEYRGKRELTEREMLEICVGAILAQSTSWRNAESAIVNINENGAMDLRALATMPPETLGELVRSSGFYNQKAGSLRAFCSFVLEDYGSLGRFFSRDASEVREELLGLRGIGPETADSMLLYAGEKPVFVADAYTKRVSKRYGLGEKGSYEGYRGFFEQNLPRDPIILGEFHALIVRLCKDHCLKLPLCGRCPLTRQCEKNI